MTLRLLAVLALTLLSIGMLGVAADRPATETTGQEPKPAVSELAAMVKPKYDDQGQLIRPTDYDDWVFLGASLGLSYDERTGHRDGPGLFLNVYMQPEAFREYARTGYFPDKTIFVMEAYEPAEKEGDDSINKGGFYEDKLVAIEVALKDNERFDLSWGYFNFTSPRGVIDKAKPMPQQFCWNCHAENGADDNVFTQFYPVLRRARENRLAEQR